mmetsp:Transcript_34378/g.60256  ORF Transcript_34378/g.60256 Transcript_34378/m.60256 type:complete len:128 (-) Transcript_34378:2469-2852(-)
MSLRFSKAVLNDFFKFTHPDTLGAAPIKIKSANTAAIRTINSYIDALQQGNPVPSQSFKFFTPAGKDFVPHNVTLKPLKTGATVVDRERLLNEAVKTLKSTLKEAAVKREDIFATGRESDSSEVASR